MTNWDIYRQRVGELQKLGKYLDPFLLYAMRLNTPRACSLCHLHTKFQNSSTSSYALYGGRPNDSLNAHKLKTTIATPTVFTGCSGGNYVSHLILASFLLGRGVWLSLCSFLQLLVSPLLALPLRVGCLFHWQLSIWQTISQALCYLCAFAGKVAPWGPRRAPCFVLTRTLVCVVFFFFYDGLALCARREPRANLE